MTIQGTDPPLPPWSHLIRPDHAMAWRAGRLVTPGLSGTEGTQGGAFRRFIVDRLYATQNRSRNVRRAVSACLARMPDDGWALNLGSGATRIHPRALNVDLSDIPEVDVVSSADHLPFKNSSMDLI